MTLSQRLRTCAKHTGLDSVIELLQEAADEIDALQARAPVQGEREAFEAFAQNCPMGKYSIARRGDGYDSSHTQLMWDAWQARAQVQGELSVDQMREMLSVHKLAIVPMRATHAMLDAMSDDDWQWSDLLAAAKAITEDEYDWIDATPQPAHATQAEATDAQRKTVDQIMEQAQVFASAWALVGGRFDSGDALDDAHEAKEELREIVSRATLTLRPEKVPMTDDDVDAKCLTIIGHLLSRRERDRIVWRMAEAHHNITAQAKKGAE